MLPELDTCLNVLEGAHRWAEQALDGLPPAALNWRPTEGEVGLDEADPDATNSLAGLVMHIAGSERYLIGQLAGGRSFVRDRPAEFRADAMDAEALRQVLRDADAHARAVMSALTAEQLEEPIVGPEGVVPRRWALVRAAAHSGLHAGHMQLTRQLYLNRDRG
jgi:hypothetical protein